MDNILKISEAASLAMHATAYLAAKKGNKVSTKEIAGVLGASEHHLAKVLQRLTKGGLVNPVRGPKGGFMLSREASEISLLDVYETIEGNFITENCLFSSRICRGDKCILGDLLETLNRDVMEYFANTSLSEIENVYR